MLFAFSFFLPLRFSFHSAQHVLTGHTGKVYAGAFTSDSERVFTGAHDRTLKVWNVSSGYCKATISCGSVCNYLSVSGGVEMIATAHLDTHVRCVCMCVCYIAFWWGEGREHTASSGE